MIRRQQAALWTFVLGLALTAAVGWEMDREAINLDRQRMEMRVAELRSQLDSRIEKSEMLLNNLRDYLMFSNEARNEVFDRWCYENGLSITCPWVLGIMVATNTPAPNWPMTGSTATGNWSREDQQVLQPIVEKNPIHCVLALQNKLTNGMQFLGGYDLQCALQDRHDRSSSRRPLAITILGSRLGMSKLQPVMLDSSSNVVTGTLYYVPIYKTEMNELLAHDQPRFTDRLVRWLHFKSAIIAPVDFRELERVIWEGNDADLEIEMFASTNQIAETWLNPSGGIPRAADATFSAYMKNRQLWPMYGNKFSLFFYTTPLFEAQSPRRFARIAMGTGGVLTLLATSLIGLALRSRDQQAAMADQIREARDALAESQKAREQFSRDLHDGTVQSLYAVQLGLGHLSDKLDLDPSQARREFATIRKELDGVIAEVRNFVNAGAIDRNRVVNFTSVLHALVQRAQAGTSAKIAVQCDSRAVSQLGAGDAVQLSNIVREAISNSLRHAKPANVTISLRRDQGSLILEMKDDGMGFDPHAPQKFGVGLRSMQSRTQEMGGTFVIESSATEGTRIQISIPTQDTNGT